MLANREAGLKQGRDGARRLVSATVVLGSSVAYVWAQLAPRDRRIPFFASIALIVRSGVPFGISEVLVFTEQIESSVGLR